MASNIKWTLLAIGVLFVAVQVKSSQEVMNKLTLGFGKVLEQCKNELGVGEHIMSEFFSFWREEYELVDRDMGCILLCMAAKHDLISDDMKIHHGNAQEFAKKHGADDDVAQQIVAILHGCESDHAGVEDLCNRALEIAKCFKTKIHELKWAPSMQTVLEEVMVSA